MPLCVGVQVLSRLRTTQRRCQGKWRKISIVPRNRGARKRTREKRRKKKKVQKDNRKKERYSEAL